MDLGLKNKVIVVTGGASDIGNGIVRMLSRKGQSLLLQAETRKEIVSLKTNLKNPAGLYSQWMLNWTNRHPVKKQWKLLFSNADE